MESGSNSPIPQFPNFLFPIEADGKDFLENLNADSLKAVTAYVELSLAKVHTGQRFQFERHRYFVTDLIDQIEGKYVFNRAAGMKGLSSK